MSNRKPLVVLTSTNNQTVYKVKSELLPVTRGVPEKYILGPMFFTLLKSDLPQNLEEHCTAVMYIDSALIIAYKDKVQLNINSYIAFDTPKEYCYANDLELNEEQQLIYSLTKSS